MSLLQTPGVAIEGSKFKAVNNRDRNFTHAKMARRMAQIEEGVSRYLRQLDSADRQEPSEAISIKATRIKEKIARLKQEMSGLEVVDAQMRNTPDQQISFTDPDDFSMPPVDAHRVSSATMSRSRWTPNTSDCYARAHKRWQRSWAACSDVEASQRSARSGQTRGGRRPLLFRRRRDIGLREGWRCSHLAQAHDAGRQGGGPGSANKTSPTCLMGTSTAAHPASCCPITTPTASME